MCPFGALFFGCVGDLAGRRVAFIATLSIMGASTASIGLLPTYPTAGWFAPIALILIRLLQGLALGGEYGGAAVYLAEHVPDRKRGFYTSFLQITAGLGLVVSLGVILTTVALHDCREFSGMGGAFAVPSLHRVREHLALHSHPHAGIADFLAHQGIGNSIHNAYPRRFWEMGEP